MVNTSNIHYWGSNEKIANAITFVLQNVPELVKNFALRECIFTSLDKNLGGACIKLIDKPDIASSRSLWLIELSENIFYENSIRYKKCSQNMLRYIVAHELAHTYLNHVGIHSKTRSKFTNYIVNMKRKQTD